MNKSIYALLVPLLLSFLPLRQEKIKVYLIGDSTMSDKDVRAYPETGWGMPFACYFNPTVTVDNRAKNGRSTRSFIAEKRWQSVEETLQEGDYVLIQFGHNDEVPTKATYTPESEFTENLVRFIRESRARRAIPVLITPVARRKFDSSGKILETHAVYAALVRKTAAEQQTPLIDLDEESQRLIQQFGPDDSRVLFNYLEPGENPNYPDGKKDDTHFNEFGARRIAELVLHAIKAQQLGLAEYIVKGMGAPKDTTPGTVTSPAGQTQGHDEVADNMLLYQRAVGGWPKHIGNEKIDYHKRLSPAEKAALIDDAAMNDATIDNEATTKEIRYLVRASRETGNKTYLQAAEKGIRYLLAMQYKNGGFPQFFPDKSLYRAEITYNDNAMINALNVLDDVARSRKGLELVDPSLKGPAADAVLRGVDCILRSQWKQGDKLTAWCAQVDERTLQPAKARRYELPSLSGEESVGIVAFLMDRPHSSPEIRRAVAGAVEWFDKVKIEGVRFVSVQDATQPGGVDRVLQPSPGSVIWARFYDLKTNLPFFCGRDGVRKNSVADIEYERRNGYAWYGTWPAHLLEKDYPAWVKANP